MSQVNFNEIKKGSIFQASWNDQLKYDDKFISVIARKIKNFIFYIPNSILATVFNPRPETKSDNLSSLTLTDRISEERRITTPDNVHLKVKIEAQKSFTKEAPTVILFNPLGTNYGFHNELNRQLLLKKCNVVSFDYRGLGTTWRAKDLVVDGDSVCQYVINQLGVNPNKVHLYGTSLGAAIAAQVKSLHPETGKYVSDRGFKSVFSLITEKCCISGLGKIIKKITTFAVSIFLAYPVKLLDWEFDHTKVQLGREKLGVYHPNDFLVPFDASLASQFKESSRLCLDSSQKGGITHFSPIEFHRVDNSQEMAIDRISNFLAD